MTPASAIIKVHARQILDSRGKPTVEVEVTTALGVFRASVPSGASTGSHEACELRDKDSKAFLGQGVFKALHNVNTVINDALVKSRLDVTCQSEIDALLIRLDGTTNKSNLGANAILGVSLAVSRAAAAKLRIPLYEYIANLAGNSELILPVPSFNVINGGSHAGNKVAFQEFMVTPIGAKSMKEAVQVGAEIYQILKTEIKSAYGQTAINVGDEGGFAPDASTAEECLQLLTSAIEKSGHSEKVKISLDVAASEFFQDGGYNLSLKDKDSEQKCISGEALGKYYLQLAEKFRIFSIEDPFAEDDWSSWTHFVTHSNGLQVVADDLTVTNPLRIAKAIGLKAANALLLKVNQIGTLTESIAACRAAKEGGWRVMVSHRSGETEDSYIADLAVGLGAGQIKSGAPCRSERLAKYNQLLRIEEELGAKAKIYSLQ